MKTTLLFEIQIITYNLQTILIIKSEVYITILYLTSCC